MEWEELSGSEGGGGHSGGESLGEKVLPVGAVFYCATCHNPKVFCINCHGTTMPHATAFKEPKDAKDPAGHPALSKVITKKCLMCHGENSKTHFCDKCHHGKKVDRDFDVAQPWVKQHPKAVAKAGVNACTEKCHAPTFCAACHKGKKVVPSSHRSRRWVHPASPAKAVYGVRAAAATAGHAVAALESLESCAVCHGPGGTSAKRCQACHKLKLPHSAEFKKFHATGRKHPQICRNCHGFKELCSGCHHVGSNNRRPWIKVHGGMVAKNGSSTCLEKCHKKTDCQNCHFKRKVKPASHKRAGFRKLSGKGLGKHAQLYKKDSSICTLCHKGAQETLPLSKFCKKCHKLDIPHSFNGSEKQKFVHKPGFQKHTLSKSICWNCHESKFCDNCHHPAGEKVSKVWVRYHPNVVKKNGSGPCTSESGGTGCHKEEFCSDCHVNRAAKIIGR
jgi:hypothetical protein